MNRRVIYPFVVAAAVYTLTLSSPVASGFSFEAAYQWMETQATVATSLKTAASQTAVTASLQSQAVLTSSESLANSIVATSTSQRVKDAMIEFDMKNGTAESVKCTAQVQSSLHVEAKAQSERDANRLTSAYAGSRSGSPLHAENARLSVHRTNYCSIDEARFGACELSMDGMQAFDSDYGGAFGADTIAPEVELAGLSYIANVVELPSTTAVVCATPGCESVQEQNSAATAMLSMVTATYANQLTGRRVPVLSGR